LISTDQDCNWIDCHDNANETNTSKLVVAPDPLVVYFDKKTKDSVVIRTCSMQNVDVRQDIRFSFWDDDVSARLFELARSELHNEQAGQAAVCI